MATNSVTQLPPVVDEMLGHLKSYLRSGNSLGILVAGKTGVGKSSLINSIYYGARIADEGDSVEPVTEFIVSYTMNFDTPIFDRGKRDTTILTAWDSPGFGDMFASEDRREQRICEMQFTVDKADVLLYCFDIRLRMARDDIDGIVEITKAVGPDIWRKAVFVLTFSNEFKLPLNAVEGANLVSYFKEKLKDWRRVIYNVLKKQAGIPENIAEDISIVPAGYRGYSPPDRQDWYTPFWLEVFKKTRETGKPGLLRLTWLRLSCEEDKAPSFNQRPDENYSLPVNLFQDDQVTDLIQVGNLRPYLPDTTTLPHQPTTRQPQTHVPPRRDTPSAQPSNSATLESSPNHSYLARVEPNLDTGNPPPRLPSGGVGSELRTTANETSLTIDHEDELPPADRKKKWKKAAKIGAAIGVSAVAGALVGMLIGIAGGPIGMGAGAAAGFVIGGSSGVGGVIAKAVAKRMKEKKTEQKQAATVNPDEANIN